MKIIIGLVLCLGAALSWKPYDTLYNNNLESSILQQDIEEDNEYNHQREFVYIYNGQLLTGIPGTSKQHSGSRIQAKVRFVCKGVWICDMQLEHVSMGKLNRRVGTPKNMLPMSAYDPLPLESKQRQVLSLPVKFTDNVGDMANVVFDGRDQPWSANIKRGVINMFQVKIQQPQARSNMDLVDKIEDKYMDLYKPTESDSYFYRTLEKTVEGNCEATYTVTKPPELRSSRAEVLNLTRTINFEKCIDRPQIKYNFNFAETCPTCDSKYTEDQKFLKSSSITSYQVIRSKNVHVTDNAYSESQYVFVPFNEEANMVVTYVSQNVKLIKNGFSNRRIPTPMYPRKSDSDLVFNFESEIGKEKFHMDGDVTGLREALHEMNEDKVQLAKNLLKKLVNNMQEQVHEPATKHFTHLVNLFRLMPKPDIDRVHNTVNQIFNGRQQKIAQDLLHDILGSAGTKPTVQHIVQKIKQRQIPIGKAVSAIKNMMIMRTPSKDIIEELISLGQSPISQNHYMLKQATWLTVGTLMNTLCSNNDDQWALESKESIEKYCPIRQKQEFVKLLTKKLHSSQKWDDRLIYIKALGNAGIDISVFELEKIINNREYNYRDIIRIESILALRQLVSIMPKKIQKVLTPVVLNKMESETVRITAAYMLLRTLPKRPILDQLAKLTHNERSIQVASFLDTYMRSLANSTNPCEKEFADNLKLSLRHTHKIFARPANSRFTRFPLHNLKEKYGVDLDLSSVFANEKPIPRQLTATVHGNFLGLWSHYLLSLRLTTEGIEQAMNHANGQPFGSWPSSLNQVLGEQMHFNKADLEKLVSPINVLEPHSNDPSSATPKAILALKIKNQDVAFLPIKQETIQSMLRFGHPSGTGLQIEEQLRRGININFNKATMLEEIFHKIPTTIGIPVMVHIKVPVVMNVHGAIKLTPSNGENLGAFQLKAALKPSLVASVSVDVQAWTPVVATGANLNSKIKLFKPIDAKVQVDLNQNTKSVKVLFKPPTHKRDILTIESKPTTFTLVQPKQTLARQSRQKRLVLGEEGNRVRTIHQCNSIKLLGTQICIKGRYHKTPQHRPTESTIAPLSGPNQIVVSMTPTQNRPETVAVSIHGKFFNPVSMQSFQPNTLFTNPLSLLQSIDADYMNQYQIDDNIMTNEPMDQSSYDSLMQKAAQNNKVFPSNPLLSDRNSKRPLVNKVRIHIETSNNRRASFDFEHVFNLDGDFHKIQTTIAKNPTPENPQPWKFCLNSEAVAPTLKMIRHLPNQQVIGKLNAHWGTSCSSSNFVHITKRLEKNQQSRLHELANPEWNVQTDSNLKHDQLLKKSPIKFNIDVQYNNVPLRAKHYANEVLRMIKRRQADQVEVAEVAVQNRPQHVRIIAALDPVTLKKYDVLIKTPKSNVLIRDLHVPTYLTPITHKQDYLKNQERSLAREALLLPSKVQCYASEYKIKTFQDKELPMPQSHAYKVLSKDCATNQYTVLIRKLNDYSDLKEVKIITPNNHVTLKPYANKLNTVKVFVDGQDFTNQDHAIKTQAGRPVLKIVKQSSHVKVEILTAGVSVYFDRKSVNVEVPPHKTHAQCGICSSGSLSSLRSQFFAPSYLNNPTQAYGSEESQLVNEMLQQQDDSQTPFESQDLLTEQELDIMSEMNQLRDYSNTDDALSYYFGVNPLERMWRRQFQSQSSYADQEDQFDQYDTVSQRNNIYARQNALEQVQGWNRPQERQWELDQETSDVDDQHFQQIYGHPLHSAQRFNDEFDNLYTPLPQLERRIDLELRREPWWSQQAYETLAEDSYAMNPYLSHNYLINDRQCQYMPFSQRQLEGCNDYPQAFDMNQYGQMEQEAFNNAPFSSYNLQYAADQDEIDQEIEEPEMYSSQGFLNQLADDEETESDAVYRQYHSNPAMQQKSLSQQNTWSPTQIDAPRKQKFFETEHSICISTQPIKCPDDSDPAGEKVQDVPYRCMNRRSTLAQKMLNELTSGRQVEPQLIGSAPSLSRREIVPVACRRHF